MRNLEARIEKLEAMTPASTVVVTRSSLAELDERMIWMLSEERKAEEAAEKNRRKTLPLEEQLAFAKADRDDQANSSMWPLYARLHVLYGCPIAQLVEQIRERDGVAPVVEDCGCGATARGTLEPWQR